MAIIDLLIFVDNVLSINFTIKRYKRHAKRGAPSFVCQSANSGLRFFQAVRIDV